MTILERDNLNLNKFEMNLFGFVWNLRLDQLKFQTEMLAKGSISFWKLLFVLFVFYTYLGVDHTIYMYICCLISTLVSHALLKNPI